MAVNGLVEVDLGQGPSVTEEQGEAVLVRASSSTSDASVASPEPVSGYDPLVEGAGVGLAAGLGAGSGSGNGAAQTSVTLQASVSGVESDAGSGERLKFERSASLQSVTSVTKQFALAQQAIISLPTQIARTLACQCRVCGSCKNWWNRTAKPWLWDAGQATTTWFAALGHDMAEGAEFQLPKCKNPLKPTEHELESLSSFYRTRLSHDIAALDRQIAAKVEAQVEFDNQLNDLQSKIIASLQNPDDAPRYQKPSVSFIDEQPYARTNKRLLEYIRDLLDRFPENQRDQLYQQWEEQLDTLKTAVHENKSAALHLLLIARVIFFVSKRNEW